MTIGWLVAGCIPQTGEPTMTEDTKRAARRFYETLNQAVRTGDMALLDSVLAPDVVDHNPTPDMAPGREGIKRAFAEFRATFPDFQTTVDDLIAEGDKAACRVTGRMTHQGKQVKRSGIDILLFHGGKLTDRWGQFESPPTGGK
jgi:predicted ester cyclase